jgi:ParB family chromosome partitioning protein
VELPVKSPVKGQVGVAVDAVGAEAAGADRVGADVHANTKGKGAAAAERPTAPAPASASPSSRSSAATPVVVIPLDKLSPNPFQPRGRIDEAELRELAASIAEHGLLQPITVRRQGASSSQLGSPQSGSPTSDNDPRYEIIAGHRRVEAFRRLRDAAEGDEAKWKYSAIPAQERASVTDEQMAIFALVENLQRADLSPLDAATALAKLQQMNPALKTAKELAAATGLQVERVRRLLRLYDAPEVIKNAVTGVFVAVASKASPASPDAEPATETATKRERRSLDLLGALELRRAHEHLLKVACRELRPGHDDKKIRRVAEDVDERLERIVQRALEESWGLRKIEAFVERLLAGEVDRGTEAAVSPDALAGSKAGKASSAFRSDAKQLVIRKDRVDQMSATERSALREVLEPIWTVLLAAEKAVPGSGIGKSALGASPIDLKPPPPPKAQHSSVSPGDAVSR